MKAAIIVGSAMYPKGTWEQYPNMVNSLNQVIENSAHDYMECSNKGICDRSAGTCTCFDGYDGSACQRASCPSSSAGVCSGHGTCATAKNIARADYNNSYNLWDEQTSMGCLCDYGYEGPDCSDAMCKVGVDPLYHDDQFNIRYSNFTFVLWNIDKVDTTNDVVSKVVDWFSPKAKLWSGNFSLVFYDAFGQDWHTEPIDIKADCDAITNAVESLPNNVVEAGSVRCSLDKATYGAYVKDTDVGTSAVAGKKPVAGIADGFPIALPARYSFDNTYVGPFVGAKFTLAFSSNPGKLKQPSIDIFLDGSRPTVTTGSSTSLASSTVASNKVYTWVYPNGFSGEDDDFTPDYCAGVKVTLAVSTSVWSKLVLDDAETILLKKCLGDSDGGEVDNNSNKKSLSQDALYDWDYGYLYDSNSFQVDRLKNPHLIKLVTSTASSTGLCTSGVSCVDENPAGFYAVLYYDGSTGTFQLLSSPHLDYASTTEFYVFTTTGYLKVASTTTDVFTSYMTTGENDKATSGTDLSGASLNSTDLTFVTKDLSSFYSNVVYTYYKTTSSTERPNVDCETKSTSNVALNACIQKGDYVMIMNTDSSTVAANPNPKYPNIYQVMKISRENREAVSDGVYRYQIVLDMGMNARYLKVGTYVGVTTDGTFETTTFTGATNYVRIFKFTPPTQEVSYVGPCSLRGICDTSNGICGCFPGYTGDDCSTMNALAQ